MYPQYGTGSGQQTGNAQISIQRGALLGIDVIPPSSGFATVLVYDSEDSNVAGKRIISEVVVDAGYISMNHEYFVPQGVNRGIYCTIVYSGGSAADSHYYVRYLIG